MEKRIWNDDELVSLLQRLFFAEEWKRSIPDVYHFVTSIDCGSYVHKEWFVIERNTPNISEMAKLFGMQIYNYPQFLYYNDSKSFNKDEAATTLYSNESGYRIVQYEVEHNKAHPKCSEIYPAPAKTAFGLVLHHKKLFHGVYLLDTPTEKNVLSICYPLWKDNLSKEAMRHGYLMECGCDYADGTVGCLFFQEREACIAIFELLLLCPELNCGGTVAMRPLQNAIAISYPEYTARHNKIVRFQFWREGEENGDRCVDYVPGYIPKHLTVLDDLIHLRSDIGADYLLL